MNSLLLHVYIFATIYAVITFAVFFRLLYLVRLHKIQEITPGWFKTIMLDSLLWPYYSVRYGVESFWKEIK
jgi:hypothetical protein